MNRIALWKGVCLFSGGAVSAAALAEAVIDLPRDTPPRSISAERTAG